MVWVERDLIRHLVPAPSAELSICCTLIKLNTKAFIILKILIIEIFFTLSFSKFCWSFFSYCTILPHSISKTGILLGSFVLL